MCELSPRFSGADSVENMLPAFSEDLSEEGFLENHLMPPPVGRAVSFTLPPWLATGPKHFCVAKRMPPMACVDGRKGCGEQRATTISEGLVNTTGCIPSCHVSSSAKYPFVCRILDMAVRAAALGSQSHVCGRISCRVGHLPCFRHK